jgi:predicted phage terminase large subunit-like protein
MIDMDLIRLEAKKELARREFFYFCHLLAPKFYKEDREYLNNLCNELQEFLYSDDEVLVVNAPPRHGKSRTAQLLVNWILGKDKTKKIITGSYNIDLSTNFSKGTRNVIMEEKGDEDKIVYRDIFPEVIIKHGDGAMNRWSLEGGYNNYLATSPGGSATGFGADIIIIDDLIKLSQEAYNMNVLDAHWKWFTNTMLSRLEEGGKIIIIMTRWATKDLAGRVLKWCKKENKKYKHINLKAHLGNGKMLCPEVLSYKSYKSKISAMSEEIVRANYDQEPIDIKGKLYSSFKTYKDIPRDDKGNPLFTGIYSYTDTADEGTDYLCTIIFGVYNKEAYILDVYYTQKPMEETEKEVAKKLYENEVNMAYIESNNGGRGFARQVESHLLNTYKSNKTSILWFHQSQNKKARILSNASWVIEHIYYPVNWADRWPEYFQSMNEYQREGKNAHDDAQDATTGVTEIINNKISTRKRNYSGKGAR